MAISKSRIDEILKKHKNPEESLIAVLQDVQAIDGYISRESVEIITELSGIPSARIMGVASFYAGFRLKPVGKYRIMVCMGTACHVNGGERVADTLRRTLKYNGYTLKHAMNITDVGHLVSDADEGEDKMLKAAKRENKNPFEIADFYTKAFLEDMKKLNIDMPEIICRATEHIEVMENYVKKIIENGYAYETENTIYFDTSKLDKYGVLSNRNIEDQKAGARVDFDESKKNPTDFALWIKAPENHLMKWDTFWGKCYPGWHLECSAMSEKYLGEVFDIHTGGMDHIPVHHENEIAQAKGYSGHIPANYWMHIDFLQVNGGKMSKSLNNLYTLEDLKEKGYLPEVYRMFNFSSHYKKPINFTFEAMDAAKVALNRLREG